MGEGPACSFAVAGVRVRVLPFFAAAFAFRCHPEPIRAKRGWVRDLLLLSPLRMSRAGVLPFLPLFAFVILRGCPAQVSPSPPKQKSRFQEVLFPPSSAVTLRSAATKCPSSPSPPPNTSTTPQPPPPLRGVAAFSPDKKQSAQRLPRAAPFPRAFCSRSDQALPPRCHPERCEGPASAFSFCLCPFLPFVVIPSERSDEEPLFMRQLERHPATHQRLLGRRGFQPRQKAGARSAYRSRRCSRESSALDETAPSPALSS